MKLYIYTFIAFFCLPFISFAIEPTAIWAKAWGGANAEFASVLSLDNEGNIFVAGSTYGSFKLGETNIVNSNTRMNTSYLSKNSPSGEVIWVRGAGTGNYIIDGITNDNSGNTYIAGTFTTPTLSLGEFVLTNTTPIIFQNMLLYSKAFVAKYSPTGEVIWAIAPNNEISSRINCIALDKAGFLYFTGIFRDNQMEFGGVSILNNNINPDTNLSMNCTFLIKFDFYGNALWGKSLVDNVIGDLTVDKDGSVIMGGSFKSSTINFGNISLQNPYIGFNEIFLAKLSNNGHFLWAKSIGSNGSDFCNSITTDLDGNIYTGGSYTGATLSAGDLSIINNNKTSKSFLLKCNPEGNAQWIKSLDNAAGNNLSSVCTDKHKDIYVSGSFDGDMSFDNITLTNEMSKGRDMFILKYKSDGTIVWAKNYGADENISANSCIVDKKGDIHVTGDFGSKEIYFDKFRVRNYNYNQDQNLNLPSLQDAYLIKLKQPVDTITVMYCSANNTAILIVDDPAKSYNWMNSSGQSIGDKSELTISNPVVGDTYSCQLRYHNGSTQILKTIIAEYKIIADFIAISTCKTNIIQFRDSIFSSHFPTQLKWDFGDGTNSTQSNPSHTYSNAGKYKVSLEITNPLSACAEIIEKEIEVFDVTGFAVSPMQIDSRNNKVELNAEYNPSLQYIYDMGDGTMKQGANNIHTYNIDNNTVEYVIKLTIINESGCIYEFVKSIDVVPFIPNVFTPNADGINDIFAPNVDLVIIDRNGIVIYKGKNGWDGNYNGTKAPTDTYFYLVKYSDKHGDIQTKKGAVSLIR